MLLRAFQEQPQRPAGSYTARELLAILERGPGRSRKSPQADDRYLYVMAFQQRARQIPPEQTLLELLDLKSPTEADGSVNKGYARILAYYRNHPELYRDVILALRWDGVTSAADADLTDLPEPIFDAEGLFRQRP